MIPQDTDTPERNPPDPFRMKPQATEVFLTETAFGTGERAYETFPDSR